MPSLTRLHAVALPSELAPTASERFTRALVEMTRTVWHPHCSFDMALAEIAETAAAALQVERISIWQHDPEAGLLRRIRAYRSADGVHETTGLVETLALSDENSLAALKEVRTFEVIDVDVEFASAVEQEEPLDALRDYLQRHRIHALLAAPAYVDGDLLGVICHESISRMRKWTRDEVTFAASIGDYVGMAYEIARRRRAEAEVEHLRLHDGGTGLGNRHYMVEVIRQRLANPRVPGETMAIVHVFIDASGGVAWSAGAPTVDEVIAQIALCLRRLSNDAIDLARVRDNGFAFLLAGDVLQRNVIRLAERALAAVRDLDYRHDEVVPSAAVGIAHSQADAENDARVLLRRAEEAAEQARTGDKFAYVLFDPERHDALVEALRFERVLHDAFTHGDFEVHYEPEYDPQQRQWVAAESLLRWRDGDRLVTAAEFIAVIESSGLMLPVGRWVLQQACQDAVQWPRTPDGRLPTLRVNVSARQFDEERLVDDVTAALAASGLDPARLCLELTETTLMRDIEHALSVLQRLKRIGVQLAIDDFGTGYASLVYLKRLPVDMLKIDRSFVEGMPEAIVDTAIVRAVVGLAAVLDIGVIAEGVESLAQQHALQAIGVRRMQGWLYGKAMDQASICRLLGAPAREP